LDEADYQFLKVALKMDNRLSNGRYELAAKLVITMFSFALEIRKAIYTTNTIESLNMTLRKVIKNRPLFPSDEAVLKIMYLALRNISKKWTMPIQNSQRRDESIRHFIREQAAEQQPDQQLVCTEVLEPPFLKINVQNCIIYRRTIIWRNSGKNLILVYICRAKAAYVAFSFK
jgi:Transposase, Mutator family